MLVPHRLLICSANARERSARLAHAARTALDADAQIVVLAAHQRTAAALSKALHADTGEEVSVLTVRQYAQALLRRFPHAAHLPDGWNNTQLMSGIERRMLIKHAWAEVGSSAASLWAERGAAPGALDWVARVFDRWSAWAGTADPERLPHVDVSDPQIAELWQAYRRYLALCHTHQVLAFSETFGCALDLLRVLGDKHLQPSTLLLADADLFDPAEWLFVDALIGSHTQVIATCAALPIDDSAVDHVRALHRWITKRGFVVEQEAGTPPPQPSSAVYASPDDEADAVAEQIAAHAAGRWSDHAVVSFDPELVPLLRRALAQRGVPVDGQDARDGYTILLVPLARIGLKVLAAQPLTVTEERTLARWTTPTALDVATRMATALSAPPRTKLDHWLQALDLPQRCWEHTAAVLPQWAVEADQEHWQWMWMFMERAEQLAAALGMPFTLPDLLDILDAAQALIVPTGAPLDDAVPLWQPSELGGCTAQHVFVVGLHEGALPQPLEPLPFGDAAFDAFAVLPGFVAPQTGDRAAAWERGMRDLERVVGCAETTVTWSYSRTDRAGRRQLPSPLVGVGGWGLRVGEQEDKETKEQETEGKQSSMFNLQSVTLQPAVQPSAFSLQPSAFSQSALEDYFVCPRRALYARQLKLHDVAAAPRQALGQVVHHALRTWVEHGKQSLDQANVATLVAQHWNNQAAWGSRLKHDVFHELAERAVQHQVRYEAEQVRTVTLGCEVRFRWQLPNSDVVITGQIDRIDRDADGLHIVDYKLGQTSPSLNTLLAEFVAPLGDEAWRPGDVQLPIYALAAEHGELEGVERLPGERVASVALVYPLALYNDAGRLSATGVRRITVVDHGEDCPACTGLRSAKAAYMCRQQLDAVLERVHQAIDGMRQHVWPADPRDGARTCSSCPFRPICPHPQ